MSKNWKTKKIQVFSIKFHLVNGNTPPSAIVFSLCSFTFIDVKYVRSFFRSYSLLNKNFIFQIIYNLTDTPRMMRGQCKANHDENLPTCDFIINSSTGKSIFCV